MQVMLMRLMSKGEYHIVPKGTKIMGSGKLGLTLNVGATSVSNFSGINYLIKRVQPKRT